ncbi:hypothetical protein C8A05DRAFT_20327 [Staphylotrichum tortipilum]|uniref:Uncharacterized protein n=1 Tax=Staphylotrichum tortipilum TaxID=2831512 RepID=A0AAN6MAW1_9PEZI|nr:hypothetical protein C8A05DRAFT_20327 [Staphylotrichum longicolle]
MAGFASQIWCLFILALSVWADFDYRTPRHDGQGPLGVTLDYSLARSWPKEIPGKGQDPVARNFVWTSHIVLNGPVSRFTDGQLWRIALDAWNEIHPDMAQYGIPRTKNLTPLAMSILAFDNEIILASSQKGKQSFSYASPENPVSRALNACQIMSAEKTSVSKRHKNQGKCGEEMAAHIFYRLYPGQDLASRNAVVGTWVADNHLSTVPVRTDPCGIADNVSQDPCPLFLIAVWGCNLFVETQKLRVLDPNIADEPYDFAAAGGVRTINQIQLLC